MNKQQAQQIIKETFESSFDKNRYVGFINNLLNGIDAAPFTYQGNYIPDAYKQYIKTLERIGKFSNGENSLDILVITLQKETSLERARTMQRNFIAWYLNGSRGGDLKDAALAAFVSPDAADWRFSLVKMDYKFEKTKTGRMKVKEEFTPARRWSFLVGAHEKSHTAQSRLVNILADDEQTPTLEEIEKAFDIETVAKEYFLKYRELFLRTKEELDKVVNKDPKIKADFEAKCVDTVNFSKKLLGQIVFLYFLQKKGWFGVGRDDDWGTGSKHFLRELFEKSHSDYKNFYNDILEPLFYEALRIDRSHDDGYYSRFDSKIPFLNGGLFDPIGNYDWVHTDINIPDKLFSNTNKTKEGDTGDGILDIFDRYNFTVKEDEPLEKEVAIDPELLGKAYEKFNAIRPDNFDEFQKALKSGRKGEENKFNKKFGVYYTPREIVHYMCQQSLINYLATELEGKANKEDLETLIHAGEQVSENEVAALIKEQNIKEGKQKTSGYKLQLSESIRGNARLIDRKLADITVCDPAVGSGAFPVGMMSEIVRSRNVLSVFIQDKSRTAYDFKRCCIEHSLYGVDIDQGAVEIAKLRLWLSLVVDEDDIKNIKPLPNLDYKIVCGDSLFGVEKDLFNINLFTDLEKMKPLYFNETNPSKKQEYKKQIDNLISEISNGHVEFDIKVYFSEVFHNKGGFDVVIANPPYVQFQKLILNMRKKLRRNPYYESQSDLWYFFVFKTYEVLRDRGKLTFIVSNYFLQAGHGGTLREFISNKFKVLSLVDFTGNYIFENVGVHNIIMLLEKGSDNNYEFPYIKCRQLGQIGSDDQDINVIERESLGRIWRLLDKDANKLIVRLAKAGKPLSSFCKISNGVKSGEDSVFILSEDNEDIHLIEESILRGYLKNSDIHKYYIDDPKKSIIYINTGLCLKDYPIFKSYIKKYQSLLEAKWKKRGEKGEYWKLYRPREEMYNYGNRLIITPYRTKSIGFAFNEDYISGTDTYLIMNCLKRMSDKTLLGLLNSRLVEWFYEKIGKRKGLMYEIATSELSLIPIIIPSERVSKDISKYVEEILLFAKGSDYIQNPKKNTNVKSLEAEIDQLVYKLYDLTPEEINIVEEENGNVD